MFSFNELTSENKAIVLNFLVDENRHKTNDFFHIKSDFTKYNIQMDCLDFCEHLLDDYGIYCDSLNIQFKETHVNIIYGRVINPWFFIRMVNLNAIKFGRQNIESISLLNDIEYVMRFVNIQIKESTILFEDKGNTLTNEELSLINKCLNDWLIIELDNSLLVLKDALKEYEEYIKSPEFFIDFLTKNDDLWKFDKELNLFFKDKFVDSVYNNIPF